MNNSLKNKRRFRPLILFLCIVISISAFCFTGCNTKKKKAPPEIIIDVKNHFRRKYAINVKILDSTAEYKMSDDYLPEREYTGEYSLECEADGRKFNVYVRKDGEIKDDYQHTDIKKSLENYFSEMLPSPDIKIEHDTGLLSEYIDCSDMEGFLKGHFPVITIYLVDSDLNSDSFDEIKNFARRYHSTLILMSCRNEEGRAAAVNGILTRTGSSISSDEITPGSDYAMYVKEVWRCRYSSPDNTNIVGYYKYKIGSYGDLYYTLPEKSEIEIKETNEDYYFKDEYHKYELITPSFDISCSDNITVFYPVSKAKKVELKADQDYKCGGNHVDIIGDYFVYRIHTKGWYDYYYPYINKSPDRTLFGVYIE